jgi:DNA-binding response OmpR family regulator
MPTVLIVEDHDHTRRLLGKVFSERGWDVREAGTVADALAALEPPPHCVIVDLNLPDGDGTDVLRAVRSGAASTTVVVVITALSDVTRLARAAALRPHLMIQKPFDWEIVWRYCEAETGAE